MRIQEAIFEVSELQKEVNRLRTDLYRGYHGPISVNDKDIDTGYLKVKFNTQIETLTEKIKQLAELKAKVQKANMLTEVCGMSLTEALVKVKELRSLIQSLEIGNEGSRTVVENVGVVRYGMFDEEYYESLLEGYRKEVSALSQAIDEANSTTHID